MKFVVAALWLAAAVGLAEAFTPHAQRDASIHARHARLSRDLAGAEVVNRDTSSKRRCKARSLTDQPTPTSSHTIQPTVAPQAAAAKPPKPPKPSPSTTSQPKTSNNQTSSHANTSGLMSVTSPQCGASGATEQVTATTGPNGSEDWFNCGIDTNGGWNPPNVQIHDIIAKDLDDAFNEANSPFANCGPFIGMFKQYANDVGIPPIFIASIAMQESSCQQDQTGGAGEQGLMQITKDKCGLAPGGNCKDPNYNIRTGTNFFKGLLDQNGGNVLKAMGEYNGWQPKMTIRSATSIADTCCPCQNNLDYLMEFLNGWILGIEPGSHKPRLGKYFNLDKCHQQ